MKPVAKILFLCICSVLFFASFKQTKDLETYLKSYGLIDVQKINPKIEVQLAYSGKDNFMKMDMYGKLSKCYLPEEVATALSNAQKNLDSISSFYRLIVFDGTRPLHIQQLMWDSLNLPIEQKVKYLAYPGNSSLHNYGAAIDLGLINNDGVIVDMGTPFDFFGEEAQITHEKDLVNAGKLTQEQWLNRKLLRKVMVKAGFKTMSTEWWHFNYCTKEEAAIKFQLIK